VHGMNQWLASNGDGSACVNLVVRADLTGPQRLPVYPGERTFSG